VAERNIYSWKKFEIEARVGVITVTNLLKLLGLRRNRCESFGGSEDDVDITSFGIRVSTPGRGAHLRRDCSREVEHQLGRPELRAMLAMW
jgi:hypothetical protein